MSATIRFRGTMQTCKPDCGCEVDYDVKACRQYCADIAHNEAHACIVQDAYDRAYAASLRDQEPK